MRPFDIVTVPDFSGASAFVFEMRTLFLLASWLENAGRARRYPFHLVCIGPPPPSVRWLAAQCEARISVHPPRSITPGNHSNKLQGLDLPFETDRALILDVDFFVLDDISPLDRLGRCLAVCPAHNPRIREQDWVKIYTALGIALPTERIACLRHELGIPYTIPGPTTTPYRMYPYYQSGALFFPTDCDLLTYWESYMRQIIPLFNERDPIWNNLADQVGLGPAIVSLRRKGLAFQRLPQSYHGSFLLIYKSAMATTDMHLFHALGFCRNLGTDTPNARLFDAVIDAYRHWLCDQLTQLWHREYPGQNAEQQESLTTPLQEAERFVDRLRDMCRPLVQKALRQT